jgi:hypothetical protein
MFIDNIVIANIALQARRAVAALAVLALPVQAQDLNIARITDDAFAGARGVIAVNQASGSHNAQINAVVISAGPIVLGSDALLIAQRPGAPARSAGTASRSVAEISGGAFRSASGIVQINQIAGGGNVVHNAFSLRVIP